MRTSAMLSRAQNTFHHNPRLRGPVSSSLKVRKVAKKSDYSLFIKFSSKKNRIIYYFRLSLFTIHYFLAHYSLFIIKRGHYSLIIIPHPDPHLSNDVASGSEIMH